MEYVPQRGDIFIADFHEEAGHEIRGRRPAFVLSPSTYNDTVALVIICLVRVSRYFRTAGREQKLMRLELSKLAEEVSLIHQELKSRAYL